MGWFFISKNLGKCWLKLPYDDISMLHKPRLRFGLMVSVWSVHFARAPAGLLSLLPNFKSNNLYSLSKLLNSFLLQQNK
jgi:hypothetical protein